MDNSYEIKGKLALGSNSDTTTAFPPVAAEESKRERKCNLAMPESTGKAYGKEISCILRNRLRIVAIILATGFVIFFVRGLFGGIKFFGFGQIDQIIQGTVSAILVLVATLLSLQIKYSFRMLRVLEFTLFGVAALYFAFLQLVMFHHGQIVLDWQIALDNQGEVLRLANSSNILRWFALIVAYGTFVPNTWKRSAIFVGILAMIPISLMFTVCLNCPIMGPHLWQSLFDMITVLGMGSAIAIFGSYKISELHQEAIQARKLGQYQLKYLIGSGGMGEVYLGEHMMLRRSCAIKLIQPGHNGDRTSMSRFEREVKAMAKLTHWNTAEVYDYGLAEDGTFYYVMEYLPGMSLQELVDRYGPLSPARTIHFLRQICDALQEAHSIDLIHRDVKPSNVIASRRGGVFDVAKLLDFGLVQNVGVAADHDNKLTVQGIVLGSPPYMSPEQAMGKSNLEARTDIYSLGGLAYFLLTGRPPFDRETPMQILMAHVYEQVTPLSEIVPDIPPDLEEIILRCLSKAPNDRFQDAESLEEALAECENGNQWSRKEAFQWWQENGRPENLEPTVLAAG